MGEVNKPGKVEWQGRGFNLSKDKVQHKKGAGAGIKVQPVTKSSDTRKVATAANKKHLYEFQGVWQIIR